MATSLRYTGETERNVTACVAAEQGSRAARPVANCGGGLRLEEPVEDRWPAKDPRLGEAMVSMGEPTQPCSKLMNVLRAPNRLRWWEASQSLAGTVVGLWREHGLALSFYLLLSAGLTWPLLRDFTTLPIGLGDNRTFIWMLWHTKEAVLGHQAWLHSSLLFYPQGITLTTHSLGPLAGLVALPLWFLGPVAVYNGATLLGFWLTGYCMYLFARSLGLERSVALVAGTVLLVAPRHIMAVWVGHLCKAFLGAIPLTLLALHRALDPGRNARWVVTPALALLLAFAWSSELFVLAAFASGLLALGLVWAAGREPRPQVLRRLAWVFATALVVMAPLLALTLSAANDPSMSTTNSLESYDYQPDLIQFILPHSMTSRFIGPLVDTFLDPHVLHKAEAAVFLSWTGLILALLGVLKGGRIARVLAVLAVIFGVLALGPNLVILSHKVYTIYQLPIVLPYAFLTSLPGMSFWRVPGRFIIPGMVGFAAVVAFGLAWLRQKARPPLRLPLMLAALGLILFESWPSTLPQEPLRPVPHFYQEIAQDGEEYGVFDLPLRPDVPGTVLSYIDYSSYYMIDQMTHGKPIAAGYVSRSYREHPVFPYLFDVPSSEVVRPQVQINGRPADPYLLTEQDLAYHNYRYVVWHKPQTAYPDYGPGAEANDDAAEFVERVFPQRAPTADDELATVYAVEPAADPAGLAPAMALKKNWQHRSEENPETGTRYWWATSPAELLVQSPKAQQARLQIQPVFFYSSGSQDILGQEGVLWLSVNGGPERPWQGKSGEPLIMDLGLAAGRNVISLRLEAGAFCPADRILGSYDQRQLSFAVSSINLLLD